MTHPSMVRALPRFATVLAFALASAPAAAQAPEPAAEAPATGEEAPAASALTPEAEKALRDQIRQEVKAEMQAELDKQKDELRAEIRAAVTASQAAEEWGPEQDQWEAEKPKQPFFDMDGYFRVRPEAFVNFDLNAGLDPEGNPLFPRPGWNPSSSDTLAGVNQRLRVQPVLNVSEDIKIHATVDVLDNLVWGQTPSSYPLNRNTQFQPLIAFDETTVEPISGVNAVMDSIAVKRLWAEVLTPVGTLRFGRMPSHWGLGVLANDGNCLDCDYGDTWDRFTFITKIGDYYIIPGVDIPSTGAIFRPADTYQWQPFDLEQRDDVSQYVLTVAKRDSDEDVERQVLDGRVVFNYGLYNVLRIQPVDDVGYSLTHDTELTRSDFVNRDALMYIPDLWARVNWGKLRVELEAVGVFGRVGNGVLASDPGGDTEVTLTQFGGVLQADYRLVHDQLRLGLEVGFASGDSAPGMGSLSSSGYPVPGSVNGRQYDVAPGGPGDHTFNNFMFDPDYHVDLILWREIYRRVTDAAYVKPSLTYDLTPSFGFDLSAVYSRAVFASSTPGNVNDLGIEVDGALRYQSSDGFHLGVQYGILFPLGGLKVDPNVDPQIAQTVQGLFGITF